MEQHERKKMEESLERLKTQRMRLFKEKAASPKDIAAKTAKISREIQELEQKLSTAQ